MSPRSRTRIGLLACLLLLLSVLGYSSSVYSRADRGGRDRRHSAYVTQPQPIIVSDAVARRAAKRPNVVVLMADDERVADLAYMPKTRRLIERAGIDFTQGLSPNPLCCPARASFLTGQATHNNRVFTNNKTRYGGYSRLDTSETLPVWLQRSGYNTGFTGKHLNGYKFREYGIDPGWTVFNVLTAGVYRYTTWKALENGRPVRRHGYVTDYIGNRTVQMIKRFHKQDNPFFIWTAYVGPHQALTEGSGWGPPPPAPRDQGKYTYDDFPLDTFSKPSYREDISDKSPTFQDLANVGSEQALEEDQLGRALAVKAVDRANAKVIRALRATGELRNTVVVFLSDNGYLLGEHDYVGKILGFEEALRVPLMMRGPGIEPGTRASQPATIVDLTATIARIAGARPTLSRDGVDLGPVIKDPSGAKAADTLGIESGSYTPEEAKLSPWLYRGVRTNRYTYIRYSTGDVELYDRREDPFQLTNVAGGARYDAVQAELARRLAALRRCTGRHCTASFGPMPGVKGGSSR